MTRKIADTLSRLLGKKEENAKHDLSKTVKSDGYLEFVARESMPVAKIIQAVQSYECIH